VNGSASRPGGGVKTALGIKETYRKGEPISLPGEQAQILIPENLMNPGMDLLGIEDPIALAMMASRDPEPSMALAATARLSPLGTKTELVSGMFGVVGETTRHASVRKCVSLVSASAFSPDAIAEVRRHASRVIVQSRQQYTAALRHNLRSLIQGEISSPQFVHEFFELTEAGNPRNDIRKKLVLSLLLSNNIRPGLKFLMLEHFHRLPSPVRLSIISGVLEAEPSLHLDIIKEELRWILTESRRDVH
jgi:hypothetical protein